MKSLAKNALTYLGLTLFMILFSFIYHIFSHGVSSKDMQLAFLWFLCSALLYGILLWIYPKFEKRAYYRLFVNLFNTASVAQVLGAVLKGVINIAGGSSAFIPFYFWMAKVSYGLSLVAFIWVLIPKHQNKKA